MKSFIIMHVRMELGETVLSGISVASTSPIDHKTNLVFREFQNADLAVVQAMAKGYARLLHIPFRKDTTSN